MTNILEQKKQRIGEIKYNNQGCLMKIVEYINSQNIVVEFQDEYKAKICSSYYWFQTGNIKNPYFPSVYGVGILGEKYPSKEGNKNTKEYVTWQSMLQRCFNGRKKEKYPNYKEATCCNEWLLYENFYEWLHSQENFQKWLNGDKWAIDKDILVKGNKIYSPETCCLVPQNVNVLFAKADKIRGEYPIGVYYNHKNRTFISQCKLNEKTIYLGSFSIMEDAFRTYKKYKESIIKQVAQIEYDNDNISKQCYEAMMKYIVEISD